MSIKAAAGEAQKGQFYHWKRTYMLRVDEKVHSIALNLFERIIKTVVTFFSGNYFSQFFGQKNVTILDPNSLLSQPKPKELPPKPARLYKAKKPQMKQERSNEEIVRIISHSSSQKANLMEIKALVSKMLEVTINEEVQKKHFGEKEHPGIAVVDSNDFTPRLNSRKLIDTLYYMLLTGRIGFIANHPRGYGYYIGIDPEVTEDTNGYKYFYNKERLLEIDEYINTHTVSTPPHVPQDIKPAVDHMIGKINKALYDRFVSVSGGKEIIVMDRDTIKSLKLGANTRMKIMQGLDFLVREKVIHSYNQFTRTNCWPVKLEADDKMNPALRAWKAWRDVTVLDAEVAFQRNNRIEIDEAKV